MNDTLRIDETSYGIQIIWVFADGETGAVLGEGIDLEEAQQDSDDVEHFAASKMAAEFATTESKKDRSGGLIFENRAAAVKALKAAKEAIRHVKNGTFVVARVKTITIKTFYDDNGKPMCNGCPLLLMLDAGREQEPYCGFGCVKLKSNRKGIVTPSRKCQLHGTSA